MISLVKYLALFLLFCGLHVEAAFAQHPDSSRVQKPEKSLQKTTTAHPESLQIRKQTGQKAPSQRFLDRNTNGVDDRLEGLNRNKSRNRKSDKFIDLDGDGICDGRESALGLRKTMRRQRRKGKKGG